jgi:hypothetical protein
LPPIVNAPGLDESHPSFTADGRFLAFIRATGDGHEHLFVFDTQTQTLLNSNGIDLGALYTSPAFGQLARTEGNIALRQVAVFERVSLSQTGTLVARLFASGLVGILVQRIVGHHKLLGRTVSTLVNVGRVPLGQHHAGRFKTHWNLKVNGRRLKPGTYLVTFRAVTKNGTVRELGPSLTLRQHKRPRGR